MDIQALGMLSNITAIVQKQNVNTIENCLLYTSPSPRD